MQFTSFIVPSPKETIQAGTTIISNPTFWFNTLIPTLTRALCGGILAAGIGITLGLAAGRLWFFNIMLEPLRLFLSALPAPVFVILALLWVGARDATIILTVAMMLMPLFYVAARDGLRGCDVKLTEMAQVYQVKWQCRLVVIVLPALSISLLPATRVAIANALRLTVLAEILVAAGGIGERISVARQYLETAELFAMVFVLVALITTLEWGLSTLLNYKPPVKR